MATDRAAFFAIPAAAALLLWPALWNFYPIVFADTGTYLSQAIERYAGWDRPVFYSLFMLPLHATVTLWPVVIAQALLTAWLLHLVCRALIPRLPSAGFLALVAMLSVCTWLPWLVSELMPDLFTPLLILVITSLAWTPERLSQRQCLVLTALATFMIATQQSSLPLSCTLLSALFFGRALIRPVCPRDRPAAVRSSSKQDFNAENTENQGPLSDQPASATSPPAKIPLRLHWFAQSSPAQFHHARQTSPAKSPLCPNRHPGEASPINPHDRRSRAVLLRETPWSAVPSVLKRLPTASTPGATNPAAHLSVPATGHPHPRTTTPVAAPTPDRPLCSAADHQNPKPGRGARFILPLILPPVLAILALCTVNLAAHGRFAISPYGNVFLLARAIYDGPGMAVLQRDCPTANWRLCPYRDAFPATSDDFLWSPDSPLYRAGGPKQVAADAGPIIRAAILADPFGQARAALANTIQQLTSYASGDGLTPWPAQVTPAITRNFPPREAAAYAAARQQSGALAVPPALARLHTATAPAGVIACALLLPLALARRLPCAGLLLAVLLALPLSAAITGALSAPHDRYQARIMWLPPFAAALSLAALRRPPP